ELGGRRRDRGGEGMLSGVGGGEGVAGGQGGLVVAAAEAYGAGVAAGYVAVRVPQRHRFCPRRPGRHRRGEAGQRQGEGRRRADQIGRASCRERGGDGVGGGERLGARRLERDAGGEGMHPGVGGGVGVVGRQPRLPV